MGFSRKPEPSPSPYIQLPTAPISEGCLSGSFVELPWSSHPFARHLFSCFIRIPGICAVAESQPIANTRKDEGSTFSPCSKATSAGMLSLRFEIRGYVLPQVLFSLFLGKHILFCFGTMASQPFTVGSIQCTSISAVGLAWAHPNLESRYAFMRFILSSHHLPRHTYLIESEWKDIPFHCDPRQAPHVMIHSQEEGSGDCNHDWSIFLNPNRSIWRSRLVAGVSRRTIESSSPATRIGWLSGSFCGHAGIQYTRAFMFGSKTQSRILGISLSLQISKPAAILASFQLCRGYAL